MAVLLTPIILLLSVSIWALFNQGFDIGEDPMNRNFSNEQIETFPAPEFSLKLFDGTNLNLSELQGRPAMVSFWSSWCPSCRLEAPVIVGMNHVYHEQGVQFVGIAIWDSEEKAQKFAAEHQFEFPIGLDKSGTIAIDFGVTGLPEKFFLNRQGEIVKKLVGPVTKQQLEKVILSLIEE